MANDHNRDRVQLSDVHICIVCGAVFRREEVKGRAHTTGIFLCPKCGAEGPLNIEIIELDFGEP